MRRRKKENPYLKDSGSVQHRLAMSLIYGYIDYEDLNQFEFETSSTYGGSTVNVYINFDGVRVKLLDNETPNKLRMLEYPESFIRKAEKFVTRDMPLLSDVRSPKPVLRRRR